MDFFYRKKRSLLTYSLLHSPESSTAEGSWGPVERRRDQPQASHNRAAFLEKGQCTPRSQNCKVRSGWFCWLPAVAPEGCLFCGQFWLKDRVQPSQEEAKDMVPE